MEHVARVAEALAESDLFGALTDPEIESLMAFGTMQRWAAGHVIFQKGDKGDFLAVVVKGRIKIGMITAEGKEAVIDFFDPGRSFGEIALLDGKVRTADATAVEPSELFLLKRKDLTTFLERHPDVALRIIGVLCARLRRTTEMVEDAVLRSMPARIARGVLRLAADFGRPVQQGTLIDLKLSQRELGNYVGLARENVNRQLSLWRHDGIVAFEDGLITIQDMPRLRGIAASEG